MPAHCCAMQGRVDALKLLLDSDEEGSIRLNLEEEKVMSLNLKFLCSDKLKA